MEFKGKPFPGSSIYDSVVKSDAGNRNEKWGIKRFSRGLK